MSFLTFSQSKPEVSVGAGMPELVNMKFRFGNNTQLGMSAGFITFAFIDDDAVNWSLAIEGVHHYAGSSKYSELKTWYLMLGAGYYQFDVVRHYDNFDLAIYPRLGKKCYFSKKSGVNLDAGLFVPLSTSSFHEEGFRILPSGSIGLFVRF
jgi:hypothetical protein